MTMKTNVIASLYHPYDYESVTIADTAIGLTSSKYNPSSGGKATRVIMTLEDGQIRYRYDGTDPTSSEGHILNITDVLVIMGTIGISQFRAIRTGSTSGTIKVTFER